MATVSSPTLSSPGIGSGLDVNGIVSKLMAVEQLPLQQLATKEAADQARISAFGSLKGALASLQSAVEPLSTASGLNALDTKVSNTAVLTATASAGAQAGSYSIEVTQLAQAQKLTSAAFSSSTSAVGTGTLTFDFGTTAGGTFTSNGSGAKTITIPQGQESLAGIRDAVNAAHIGVTASIVNDGGSPGTRLIFSSTTTGAVNSLRITVHDDDGNDSDTAGLSQLAYDPSAGAGAGRNLTETVAAQDALLAVDGLGIRSPTNTVDGAIQGVSLNLLQKQPGTPVSLDVAAGNAAGTAVAAFVRSYNNLVSTFNSLTAYDATKKQASVLTGDSTVRTVQYQLRTLLGGQLGSGPYSTLSQIGVSFQNDGTLALDNAKLNAALAADPTAVTQEFAAMGTATDSLVSVTGFTANTVPGTYALAVGQLATRGSLTGQSAAGLTISSGVNDTLSVTLDGVTADVVLSAGTYASADALAAEIQSKINGASAFSSVGSSVSVNQTSGVLGILSHRYGSASAVHVSGTAASGLFGAAPTASLGVDAAGTLDGRALIGTEQTLSGTTGSPLDGLQLKIAGGNTGARGTVTYQTGFAYRLKTLVDSVLGTDGAISARTDGLRSDITAIGKHRDELNARLAKVQANYLAQFNALDALLANLSAQSTALTQQLASLPKINNSKG